MNATRRLIRSTTLVNSTFITPLDQEDILLLASSLDDIVDLAERRDKIDLYRIQTISDPASRWVSSSRKRASRSRRHWNQLEGFHAAEAPPARDTPVENEGDRLTRTAIGDLFSTVSDAAELVKWKDVYDLLEATMDSCEHAANVDETIAIKNA